MNKENINSNIFNYILENYQLNTPILLKDIYQQFPHISDNTIRSILKRLVENELIIKIKNGVYALPNKKNIMGKTSVYTSDVLREKYLQKSGQIIGYTTGLNFANKMGLTSQTASVDSIRSNAVSNKKREIKLNNNRFIINAPRYKVNKDNVKLLQVLDLLTDFETLSELDLKSAKQIILNYISGLKLDEERVEQIVSSYPLETQVKFYKIGGQNVIASK